jgi:hypothetical protein
VPMTQCKQNKKLIRIIWIVVHQFAMCHGRIEGVFAIRYAARPH